MKIRLTCECGRDLANVVRPPYNADFTPDGLLVEPHTNTRQEDYRRGAQDRTYTWRCRCGRAPKLRHERISAIWERECDADRTGLVRLNVFRDV